MRAIFILFMATMLGSLVYLHQREDGKRLKREACVTGWRHAAARYKVYEKRSVDNIKADSIHACKDWVLE